MSTGQDISKEYSVRVCGNYSLLCYKNPYANLTICFRIPVSNTRKIASIIFAAALLSGFFVPLSANALITSLTLTDPTGGEEWRGTQNITWTSTDDGSGNNISILLSTDGDSSYSTLVNSILSTLGTYSWDTTQSGAGPLADGNDYRIKIADPVTLLDSSSAADFTDDNTDPITTQTPNFPFDGLDGVCNGPYNHIDL